MAKPHGEAPGPAEGATALPSAGQSYGPGSERTQSVRQARAALVSRVILGAAQGNREQKVNTDSV